MILVQLEKEGFEYDIHSLVKAFYPAETVVVSADCEKNGRKKARQQAADEEVLFRMQINYSGGEDSSAQGILEIDGRPFPFHEADRRIAKNELKQALYGILSEKTGKALPWGNLTGIRPTKIVTKLLAQGKTEEQIHTYMKETYFTSEQKIDLSIQVAKAQKRILDGIDMEGGYSLYIGIPFCPTTCLYCSFTSYAASLWREQMEEYVCCLEKELDFIAAQSGHKKLTSVYIGGGTPTTLPSELLERLLTKIGSAFDLSDVCEFTVEAGRPDSITKEKLDTIRRYPVSRISINPQTMKQQTLELIGRRHTVEQVKKSFALARESGFDNINMDLILGLPKETYADVEETMRQIEALGPDSVTVHSLAVKRSARLNIQKEQYGGLPMENTEEMISMTSRKCAGMGLWPYYLYRQKNMAGNFENVGYAAAGKEGRYNILMMEDRQSVLAVGAGAMTKFVEGDAATRVENVKDLGHYLQRVDEMIERKRKKMEELAWH